MDQQRRRREEAGGRVIDAATRLHYAAGLLGDEDEAARLLRRFADAVHDLGKHLKRG